MRKWFPIFVFGVVACAGCAGRNPLSKAPTPAFDNAAVGAPSVQRPQKNESKVDAAKSAGLIVTPENSLIGKVVRYNDAGRFVVVDFPLGRTPAVDQRMFVYRRGLKVGEVKISTWQRENLVVADLTAGEAGEGDEVRNQ